MKLSIVHTTSYEYSAPVTLLTHYLRLKPKPQPYIEDLDFNLTIKPHPLVISTRSDAENNPVLQLELPSEKTQKLIISSKLELNLRSFNPFQFVIDPPLSFDGNQFEYSDQLSEVMAPYRKSFSNEAFANFVADSIRKSKGNIIAFVSEILVKISTTYDYQTKHDNIRSNSEEIFKSKAGSCKELSWMLIEMLRSVGIASRFVSGYAYNPMLGEGHELHAWVEFFLEGAGWIGVDPVSGLFTNECYIPLAASFNPSSTMPVIGTFGGIAESKLLTSVVMKAQKF